VAGRLWHCSGGLGPMYGLWYVVLGGCVFGFSVFFLFACQGSFCDVWSASEMMKILTNYYFPSHPFRCNPTGPVCFTSWRHGHPSPNSQWLTM